MCRQRGLRGIVYAGATHRTRPCLSFFGLKAYPPFQAPIHPPRRSSRTGYPSTAGIKESGIPQKAPGPQRGKENQVEFHADETAKDKHNKEDDSVFIRG